MLPFHTLKLRKLIFYIFKLFYIDNKNNFLKNKKIILIYFQIKNTLNHIHYSTFKYLPTLIFLLCQQQEKREKVCLPKVEKIQDHRDIIRAFVLVYHSKNLF
jgi:hypothetical protein